MNASPEQPTYRRFLLPLFSAIIAINPFAIDMYLPAMAQISTDLGSSVQVMQLSLSLYLLGYAAGLIIFGPLISHIGHRPLINLGLLGFLGASMLLPLTSDTTIFLALRCFQAFIGSAAIVTIPAFMRAIYGEHMAKGMSYVAMIMMLAPMVAPSIGALLLHLDSWHLIFFSLSAYTGCVWLLTLILIPRHNITGKPTEPLSFSRSYKVVFKQRQVYPRLMTLTLTSFSFFAYITAIPAIYLETYALSESEFSIFFSLNVAALIAAHMINSRLVTRIGSLRLMRGAIVASVCSSLLLLVLLIWEQHFYVLVVLLPFVLGSNALISTNADALVHLGFDKQHSGSVTAVNGTLRFVFGAMSGPLLALFYNGTAIPYAILVSATALCILLVQWVTSTPHAA